VSRRKRIRGGVFYGTQSYPPDPRERIGSKMKGRTLQGGLRVGREKRKRTIITGRGRDERTPGRSSALIEKKSHFLQGRGRWLDGVSRRRRR